MRKREKIWRKGYEVLHLKYQVRDRRLVREAEGVSKSTSQEAAGSTPLDKARSLEVRPTAGQPVRAGEPEGIARRGTGPEESRKAGDVLWRVRFERGDRKDLPVTVRSDRVSTSRRTAPAAQRGSPLKNHGRGYKV